MNDFEEYIRQGEPQKKEKGYAWQTAIGLQAVDDLKPSAYLIQTARQHIEGDITIEEAKQLIDTYYQSKTARVDLDDRTEEASLRRPESTWMTGQRRLIRFRHVSPKFCRKRHSRSLRLNISPSTDVFFKVSINLQVRLGTTTSPKRSGY